MKLTLFILLIQLCYQNTGAINAHAESQVKKPRVVKMEVTAYFTPEKSQKNYHKLVRLEGKGDKTSSGKTLQVPTAKTPGTIAADPKVFPKGTRFYIPGYGMGVFEDTGGAIKKNRLDLFMGKGQKGQKLTDDWGRRKNTKVFIF